ncbi:unnamed protein product [Nezara viridula]|uniref:Uncharacterized protein n=1 Tax=Nezara viridula TaxID=85310 RepID=A0A9P0MIL7_NEZVI|nr:unnamed protein product [Nezara viridula]
MSILCSNEKGWVISHYDYSKNLYRNVHSPTGIIDLNYNKNLFKITTPFMRDQEAEKLASFLSCDSSLRKVRKRRRLASNDVEVTESGEPVCSFTNSNGKKPYERIIFGASQKRHFKNPEESKYFLSVPSALHSHKPPLTDILKDYLPENVKCLELFARYLLPGWTSVGEWHTLRSATQPSRDNSRLTTQQVSLPSSFF